MDSKPHQAIAKITRIVTEKARVVLDRDGCVEEVIEVLEEIDCDDIEIHNIYSVLTVHG